MPAKSIFLAPQDFPKDHRACFQGLVEKGSQVAIGGLAELISAAKTLACVFVGDEMVSVGALKCPRTNYRKSKFTAAESSKDPSEYLYELGWIFTEEPHRKRGYCGLILRGLLNNLEVPVYATAKISNTDIHGILKHYDFVQEGGPFPGSSEEVLLFIREPKS